MFACGSGAVHHRGLHNSSGLPLPHGFALGVGLHPRVNISPLSVYNSSSEYHWRHCIIASVMFQCFSKTRGKTFFFLDHTFLGGGGAFPCRLSPYPTSRQTMANNFKGRGCNIHIRVLRLLVKVAKVRQTWACTCSKFLCDKKNHKNCC